MQIELPPREYDAQTVADMLGAGIVAINGLSQPLRLEGHLSAMTARQFVLQGYSLVFHHDVEIGVFEDFFVSLHGGGTYPLAFLIDQYKTSLDMEIQS